MIFHLAAQTDVRISVANPAAASDVSVTGAINMLEAVRTAGARVMFASTTAVYGLNGVDLLRPAAARQQPLVMEMAPRLATLSTSARS